MDTKRVNAAAEALAAAQGQGKKTAAGLAIELEQRRLLQSPETAAEHERVRAQYVEAAATVARLVLERGERMKVENAVRDELREAQARIAELEEHFNTTLKGFNKSALETFDLREEVAALREERHVTNEALDDAVQQLRRDQVLLAEYARQRLREGIAAEARHLLDPADQAFAELARRCCTSVGEDPIRYALTDKAAAVAVGDEAQDRFTAVASPVEYGYVIAVRRDPHPVGHVPVSLPRLEVAQWSPEAATELLHADYGYTTAPGSYWQPLGEGRYGIRLCRAKGGDR